METDVLKAALEYAQKGFSVIQVGSDKRPIAKWQEFQERIAAPEEITSWFKWLPNSNIGIVTGKISWITVVDVEAGGDTSKWPDTFTVKTGGGGYHLYYKYCPGVRNGARICDLTDIRGDGGYVVAAPSLHQSGNHYEIVLDIPMAPFPLGILQSLTPERKKVEISNLITGVESGSRNDAAAKMSGIILKIVKREDYNTTGWQLLVAWNRGNNPPLDESELRNTYQSIAKREYSKIGLSSEGETDVVHISQAITSENYSKPTPMGFPILDSEMKGGVREGDLIIITGKSGEGKTTLAQNISLNLSVPGGQSLWFSYEVITNNLYAKFKEMAKALGCDIKDMPIFVPKRNASGNLTWIREKIVESIEKYNTRFIFIDHIDYISPTNLKSGDQHRMVLRDICQELKELAIELHLTVFLIAHVKKVQGRQIEMQDIAESSGIYQLADFVLAVQRLSARQKIAGEFVDVPTGESSIRMLKNRIQGSSPEMKFLMDNNIIKSLTYY